MYNIQYVSPGGLGLGFAPIINNTGEVPLAGTFANMEHITVDKRNNIPQTMEDNPVLAPILIPGAASGDIITGPEPRHAEIMVPSTVHT